jgi:hypothetical protein
MLTGLFSQKGTVLESCDPYVASNVACRSDCAYQQTVLDWRLVSGESIPSPEALKQYLYDHGPIATGMYFNVQEFKDYDGSYTLNYAAPGDSIDHYVLLVGWSDNLPPEPGSSSPATGWIAKNSWGTDWGDAGYFYMTYGAAHIGMWSHFPHEWQAFDANEEVWFYDDFGWWSSRGCGIPTAWGLVRFIPDSDTSVTRVDFWTTDRTTDVDIYLYDSFDGTAPSSLLASKVNLTYAEAGYHSALLDSPLPVTSGNDVIAVIKFTNASHGYPVAQDKVGPIETGRTYFSCTGANGSWADLGVTNNSDVAIRLRTKRGAAPAPVVTGITPNNGTNDGVISIANLAGSSFQPGATVKLTKQGQTAINATAVTVLSASKITCQFDLTGKAPGAWDVIVTNPDTQSGSLPGGFAVKQAVIHSGEALLPLVVAEQPPVIPADATILQGYPASNYGHTSDMWTGFDHCETDGQVARSLLRFDLSAFGAGPPISRATLHIYLINSCDIGERSHQVTAYRVTSDWSETAVAWNNQPGFAEAYGSVSVPSRHWGWYSLDVTGLVRGWLDGSYPNRGLLLRSNESPGTDSARLGFSTRESPGTTKDPYIQIVRAGQAAAETVPALQREPSLPALCGPTIEGAVGIPRVLGTEAAPGFLRQSWCEAE